MDGGSEGGESTPGQLSMVSSLLTEEREGKGWRRNSRAWQRDRKLESERFCMSLQPYGEQPHIRANGEVSAQEGS